MIIVTVRLFSILRHRPGGEVCDRLTLELPPGATVADALRQLGAPDLPLVIAINGQQGETTTLLHGGDEVALIPVVAGGSPIQVEE
ncbi:MAG: MoaD/ThiS family protein [Ardenticatenaceae bacterium]|nr:MoaD/ThiS family protein [Ardenticatenaceae bacterium]